MSNHDCLYVALDVEGAGPRLGTHSTLSIGACIVPQRPPENFESYWRDGYIFYAELQPTSQHYDMEAMRIGCSQLKCIDGLKSIDQRFNPQSLKFEARLVLAHMQKSCTHRMVAAQQLKQFVEEAAHGKPIVPIVDTTFYDSSHINFLYGSLAAPPSPFGHKGIDFYSLVCGHHNNLNASLRDLKVNDRRTAPHRADQDAAYLADMVSAFLPRP